MVAPEMQIRYMKNPGLAVLRSCTYDRHRVISRTRTSSFEDRRVAAGDRAKFVDPRILRNYVYVLEIEPCSTALVSVVLRSSTLVRRRELFSVPPR